MVVFPFLFGFPKNEVIISLSESLGKNSPTAFPVLRTNHQILGRKGPLQSYPHHNQRTLVGKTRDKVCLILQFIHVSAYSVWSGRHRESSLFLSVSICLFCCTFTRLCLSVYIHPFVSVCMFLNLLVLPVFYCVCVSCLPAHCLAVCGCALCLWVSLAAVLLYVSTNSVLSLLRPCPPLLLT